MINHLVVRNELQSRCLIGLILYEDYFLTQAKLNCKIRKSEYNYISDLAQQTLPQLPIKQEITMDDEEEVEDDSHGLEEVESDTDMGEEYRISVNMTSAAVGSGEDEGMAPLKQESPIEGHAGRVDCFCELDLRE